MTVSELLKTIATNYLWAKNPDNEEAVVALIADWQAMRTAIYTLLNTDNDDAYANCAVVLNRLRLKP